MDEVRVFENVWFRSRENRWLPFSIRAYEDIGRLTVWPGMARFHGSKGVVWIEHIRSISIGRQGRDFINPWVRIEHGDRRTAFFADGRDLGWRGVLGGTKRMFGAMKHLGSRREVLQPIPV
jgi:hypothetical protein